MLQVSSVLSPTSGYHIIVIINHFCRHGSVGACIQDSGYFPVITWHSGTYLYSCHGLGPMVIYLSSVFLSYMCQRNLHMCLGHRV